MPGDRANRVHGRILAGSRPLSDLPRPRDSVLDQVSPGLPCMYELCDERAIVGVVLSRQGSALL